MKLALGIIAALATASPAFADEMPLMVFMTPKVTGACAFTVGQATAPCGTKVVYMEFEKSRRSNFSVGVDKTTVVGFSGALADQRGIAATMQIDRIIVGENATEIPATGMCSVTFVGVGDPDVEYLTCNAQTPRGIIKFTLTNASSEVMDRR